MIRNTGTGQYSLKLEFSFADKQDTIVEPGETVSLTAEFSRHYCPPKLWMSNMLFNEVSTTTPEYSTYERNIPGYLLNVASNTLGI